MLRMHICCTLIMPNIAALVGKWFHSLLNVVLSLYESINRLALNTRDEILSSKLNVFIPPLLVIIFLEPEVVMGKVTWHSLV